MNAQIQLRKPFLQKTWASHVMNFMVQIQTACLHRHAHPFTEHPFTQTQANTFKMCICIFAGREKPGVLNA